MGAGADPSQVRPFPRPRSSNRTCGFSPIRLSDWFHRRLTNARPSLNGPTDALVLRLGEGLLRRAAREEEIAPYGGAAGPSNGCASSTAAGKTASRTGKTFIWPAQPKRALPLQRLAKYAQMP